MAAQKMKRKPKPNALSRRERQIMDILYQLERATVGEVLSRLPEKPNYSTVRAQLRVLEEKGHVRHQEEGLRYVYIPCVPREVARRSALRHLVETFFEGSTEKAVAALLGGEVSRISSDELDRLAALIAREKTKVDYESTEHLATRALVPAELDRQDHLAFGAGSWGGIPLAPRFSHQAPLHVGSWNCVLHSPPSSYAAASVLAFRDTRQRRPIPGPGSCGREIHRFSDLASARDRCRRGVAALRPGVRVDFAFLGSWRSVCGGDPAARLGTVGMDFRAIDPLGRRRLGTNRSADLRATPNRSARRGVRMR